MSYRRVSIKDIARAAGVSHSTVSRALNGDPLISEDTRVRIKALASEMGYIPNAVARSLKAQRSGTVGLVLTSLTDPFFAEVMAGIDAVAGKAGLCMLVSASHNDPEREMAVIETFHRRRVEGIIVAASRLTDRYRDRLAQIHVPIVLINQHAERSDTSFHVVAFEERLGARVAVEHLLALGHRRIGYLGLGNRERSNRERLAGYHDAMRAVGGAVSPAWTLVAEASTQTQSDVEVGREKLAGLLSAGVTALLCYNDRVAIGVLRACRAQGIAVPRDLSIVGFDDLASASWVTPALTTVRQPRWEMGRLAMEMMLALLEGKQPDDCRIMPTLVVRESTTSPGSRTMGGVKTKPGGKGDE